MEGKVLVACIHSVKVEREWEGSWCGVNGISAGGEEIEKAREDETKRERGVCGSVRLEGKSPKNVW